MASIPQGSVHFGVGAMMFYSFLLTAQLVFNNIMEDAGWPIWDALAWCNYISLPLFLVAMAVSQAPLPGLASFKWVVFRAFVQIASFACSTVALRLIGAPGDVNALTSVNVVAASAIGHLFLNERLRWMHTFAVLCSLVGATLISKPAFLFGASDAVANDASRYAGYGFALMSGFLRAVALVCSRKSGRVPVPIMAATTAMAGAIIFSSLPYTPLSTAQPMALVRMDPAGAALSVGINTLIALLGMVSGAFGSMLCPAAVSATVFTGSGMVLGYVAQAFLFSSFPGPLTVVGALLMLVAVIIMAVFRVRHVPVEAMPGKSLSAIPSLDAHVASFSLGMDASSSLGDAESIVSLCDDDNESIFSFVAAEFANFEAHSDTIRLRRPASRIVEQVLHLQKVGAGSAAPPSVARTIGAAMTLTAVAV